jgi:hypothetical protein
MTSVCSGCVYLFCACRSDDNSIRITGQRETLREEWISRNRLAGMELTPRSRGSRRRESGRRAVIILARGHIPGEFWARTLRVVSEGAKAWRSCQARFAWNLSAVHGLRDFRPHRRFDPYPARLF